MSCSPKRPPKWCVIRSYKWAAHPPAWLEIHPETPAFAGTLAALDAGECAAIQLAERLGADVLLIDEGDGRKIAQNRGLAVEPSLNRASPHISHFRVGAAQRVSGERARLASWRRRPAFANFPHASAQNAFTPSGATRQGSSFWRDAKTSTRRRARSPEFRDRAPFIPRV